jgi:MFS family permease
VERQPRGGLLRPFTSLAYRDFRLLWFGQVAQASSMWTEQVARNWLTLELTGSALQLGIVNLMRVGPSLALGLWGGVLADRFNKRKLLLIIQTWSFLVFSLMAWVVISGRLELWHLYASAVALSFGQSINQPVRTALIPSLLPQQYVLQALSLNSIAINATRLGGPALVALLIVYSNAGWAYALSSGFYALMLLSTVHIHIPPIEVRQRSASLLDDLKEGIGYVMGNRLILALLLMPIGPLAFAFSFQTLLPVFAVRTLDMGAGAYGALLSVAGVGALVAGLAIASRGVIPRQGLLELGVGVLYGVTIIALGGVQWFWAAVPLILVASGSQTIFRASNSSLLLRNTPSELRGRVMGLTVISQSMMPVAAVFGGFLADTFGIGVAFVSIGTACVAIVLAVAVWEPRIRHL